MAKVLVAADAEFSVPLYLVLTSHSEQKWLEANNIRTYNLSVDDEHALIEVGPNIPLGHWWELCEDKEVNLKVDWVRFWWEKTGENLPAVELLTRHLDDLPEDAPFDAKNNMRLALHKYVAHNAFRGRENILGKITMKTGVDMIRAEYLDLTERDAVEVYWWLLH